MAWTLGDKCLHMVINKWKYCNIFCNWQYTGGSSGRMLTHSTHFGKDRIPRPKRHHEDCYLGYRGSSMLHFDKSSTHQVTSGHVRSSCQATVKHDRLFLCRTGVLPITAAPATKLASKETTQQDWEKLCRRKVWHRMEHQNKHFSPGRWVGQWAPWFSKHSTWSTWVSRSKIMAANNHRLRASSLVVSHETDQWVSNNRTSPARIINSVVYILYKLLLEQHLGPGNCGKKQSKCKTVQDRQSTRTTTQQQTTRANSKPITTARWQSPTRKAKPTSSTTNRHLQQKERKTRTVRWGKKNDDSRKKKNNKIRKQRRHNNQQHQSSKHHRNIHNNHNIPATT